MRHIATILFFMLSMIAAKAENKSVYEIACGNFDRFEVLDSVNVTYRCVPDSSGFAVFEGAKRFDNAFILKNKNNKLTIQVNTEDVNDPELPSLTIYSNFVTDIRNSSRATVRVENPTAVPSMKVTLIGNGSIIVNNIRANKVSGKINTGNGLIVLSGKSEETVLTLVGTGTLQADRLKSGNVKCRAMGSGSIGCWPEYKLEVSGLASTRIYYRGDPTIVNRSSMKVLPLDSETQREEEDETGSPSEDD